MANQYARFFAAFKNSQLKGNPFTKEEVVSNFTNGRTGSLKDLSHFELNELSRSLSLLAPEKQPTRPADDKADKMRKAIIAIFKSVGKTTTDAITWAEKQGVRGQKKKFNDYSTGDLFVLIGICEKVRADKLKNIRKELSNLNK